MPFSYQKMSVLYHKQHFSYHWYSRCSGFLPIFRDHALFRPLSVAAFLPVRLLTHVKHVFADEPELLIAASWQELESFIRRKPVSAVVLDPARSEERRVGKECWYAAGRWPQQC